jgi:hypothetical protein
MGRRTDIDNDDDEQQSTSSTSSSSIRIAHESQMNLNQNVNEDNKFDEDPLIHDTILPHRKRIRRDTLLSIQQQQNYVQHQQLNSSKINDVSLFYNNKLIKSSLNVLSIQQ